jgi:hypothetical protein
MGSEDWGVTKDFGDGYVYVGFSWDGKRCSADYTIWWDDESVESIKWTPAMIVRAVSKFSTKKQFLKMINTRRLLSK